jgi:hypothetical protein
LKRSDCGALCRVIPENMENGFLKSSIKKVSPAKTLVTAAASWVSSILYLRIRTAPSSGFLTGVFVYAAKAVFTMVSVYCGVNMAMG